MIRDEGVLEESKKVAEGEPFFPDHVLSNLMVIFLALGVLITLTTFFPAPMEEKADPFVTPEHIKPEWYFLWAYQLLKLAEKLDFLGQWAPKLIGLMGPALAIGLLVLLPLFDRGKERHPRKRPLAIAFGVLAIILFIILTVWGRYS